MGTSSCRDRNGGAEDTPSDRRLPPMPLTLAEANQVVHGALARAKELNIRISVAVCDAGGRLVAFNRMDGAIWAGAYGSQGKAIASAAFARPSGELAERAGSPIIQGIAAAEGGHMIPSQGAVPARHQAHASSRGGTLRRLPNPKRLTSGTAVVSCARSSQ